LEIISFYNFTKKERLPEVSKKKYKQFFKEQNSLPLFFEPWWLDIVCGSNNWDAVIDEDKGQNLTGIFPFFKNKIKGLPVLSNPPLSPYLGVHLIYPDNQESITSKHSFEKRVIGNLIAGIPRNVLYMNFSFHPLFKNSYPFYWAGFKQSTRYTYILNNIKEYDQLFAKFSNTLKRQIKKAEKEFKVITTDSTADLYRFLKKTLSRQEQNIPFDHLFLEKVYKGLEKRTQGKILSAVDEEGNVQASILLAWDQDTAYCLVLGQNDTSDKHNAIKLLLWDSIKEASIFTDSYNFEGSMIENVERVFRSFGGDRIPYFNISWYKNRFVRAAFAFFNK